MKIAFIYLFIITINLFIALRPCKNSYNICIMICIWAITISKIMRIKSGWLCFIFQNHRTPTRNLSQYIANCDYAAFIIHKHHLNVLICWLEIPIHRDGYEVVNHTQTLSGNRRLILTPKARKYIDMALRYNEAMVISDDPLKTFAGHKDISTTQKCYTHQNKDITEYAEEFAKVLNS